MPRTLVAVSCVILFLSTMVQALHAQDSIHLRSGWQLQSSRVVGTDGATISTKFYRPEGWYNITVPSTVFSAQVATGKFKNVFFGTNLRYVPGMTYPIGFNNFNLIPMRKDSPYAVSWWYRTELPLPARDAGKNVWLRFSGINYRANIWLNGHQIAGSKDIAGAYRLYEFNLTPRIKLGETNVLAVQTFAPLPRDLAINWVDWIPAPPDKDMGLWGDVSLSTSGPVSVRNPFIMTHFPKRSLQEADLTILADLHNASNRPVAGTVQASLDRINVQANVSLAPAESRTVSLSSNMYPDLRVKKPALWWPREMGAPVLHDLAVRFTIGGAVSDEQRARVGFREITSELTARGYRLFRINGRKILIRGAGWSQDMMMRHPSGKLEAQLTYVQDMGLNTLRNESQLESDDFYRLADGKGILVMSGWACCDVWERWNQWPPATFNVATESLRAQLLRLRNHPSMLVWLNGSDGPPPAIVERAYLRVEKEVSWPNPVLSSASQEATRVTGRSGVKMTGPYDYEPPSYWLADKQKYGGAWGFNTETSPGPAIPTLESLRKFIPANHLWRIDAVWNYHSAGERFMTMDRFNEALNRTYGKPATLADYLRKSQAMAYDGERAMFEAYGRNKYKYATGLIQWMLNNGWPSTYWHLYDYYLQPAGGYFGTKIALEPLHVQYSYNDRTIAVVNTRRQAARGFTVSVRAYDFHLHQLFARDTSIDILADASKIVFAIPPFPNDAAGSPHFIHLSLRDSAGAEISSNFYWIPAKLATMAWNKTGDTAFTPIQTFEDLTALNHLPSVRLNVMVKEVRKNEEEVVRITLRNPSQHLAFQTHVSIRGAASNTEVLPVFWSANYVSLLPGESKILTARYLDKSAFDRARAGTISVDGWNISPQKLLAK